MSVLEQMSKALDDMAAGFGSESSELAAWSPSVDVYDKSGQIVVEAELPGVKKEDMHVSFEDGVLTLRGERKQEEEVKEDHYYRRESSYGSFSRSFTLPSDVDADNIEAVYKDGVLKLKIPRSEKTTPKSISIR
jgi:HSP20 family protein